MSEADRCEPPEGGFRLGDVVELVDRWRTRGRVIKDEDQGFVDLLYDEGGGGWLTTSLVSFVERPVPEHHAEQVRALLKERDQLREALQRAREDFAAAYRLIDQDREVKAIKVAGAAARRIDDCLAGGTSGVRGSESADRTLPPEVPDAVAGGSS